MDILEQVIYPAIDDINETLPTDRKIKKSADYSLIGKEVLLDSIQIVSFIVAIEEVVLDVTGNDISLINEEVMSRTESPLTNLTQLANYIAERLENLKQEAD